MRKNKLFALLISGLMAISAMPVISASAEWVGGSFYAPEGCWAYGYNGCMLKDISEGKAFIEVKGIDNPAGDIDMDGVVTEHDAALLARCFYVKTSERAPMENPNVFLSFMYLNNNNDNAIYSLIQSALADANEDGKVDYTDIEAILEKSEYKIGDVNMDGKVNIDDASLLLKESTNISIGNSGTFTEVQKNLSDMTADFYKLNEEKSNVETIDNASYILKRYARECIELPSFVHEDVLHCYFE
ncbi:MAG: hypothetical protein IJZ64_00690 [Ruminococcus sp.]|nr:hypothetical protein [Ruminococcus sp.]